MFNKLKQFKDLRSQAKTMKSALAEETVTEETTSAMTTFSNLLALLASKYKAAEN